MPFVCPQGTPSAPSAFSASSAPSAPSASSAASSAPSAEPVGSPQSSGQVSGVSGPSHSASPQHIRVWWSLQPPSRSVLGAEPALPCGLGAFVCGALLAFAFAFALCAGVVLVSEADVHAISNDKKTVYRSLFNGLSRLGVVPRVSHTGAVLPWGALRRCSARYSPPGRCRTEPAR